jgi:hypothetical protein
MWNERGSIIKYTKIQTIKWWRHPNRMEDMKLVKKVTNWNPIEIRNNGRQRLDGEVK